MTIGTLGPHTLQSRPCRTCAHFGEMRGPHAWCLHGGGSLRQQPERGCAFWVRETGADDEQGESNWST